MGPVRSFWYPYFLISTILDPVRLHFGAHWAQAQGPKGPGPWAHGPIGPSGPTGPRAQGPRRRRTKIGNLSGYPSTPGRSASDPPPCGASLYSSSLPRQRRQQRRWYLSLSLLFKPYTTALPKPWSGPQSESAQSSAKFGVWLGSTACQMRLARPGAVRIMKTPR